jgi:hypothetical protein
MNAVSQLVVQLVGLTAFMLLIVFAVFGEVTWREIRMDIR